MWDGSRDDPEPVGPRVRAKAERVHLGSGAFAVRPRGARAPPAGRSRPRARLRRRTRQVYFASCGCDVTGVDVSAAGLHKAERLARAHGVKVRWLRGDAASRRPAGPFDLVYSCGAIHYIPRRPRARLFPRLKARTRPGGWHAHVVFTDRRRLCREGRADRLLYRGRADPRLRRLAASPVRADADRLCQDGIPHRHSVEQFIARAVGSSRR